MKTNLSNSNLNSQNSQCYNLIYGKTLKEIRESNKITQVEVAIELEISMEQVYHYEAGLSVLPMNHIIQFCAFVNIHPLLFLSKCYEKTNNLLRLQELIYSDKIGSQILEEFIPNSNYSPDSTIKHSDKLI